MRGSRSRPGVPGIRCRSNSHRFRSPINTSRMTTTIPEQINSFSRLDAAQFYTLGLGWAIHPLSAPNRGGGGTRGKKPIVKGWRNHTCADVTAGFLAEHFANGSTNNVGCVVRAPIVHVDLDSKPDGGEPDFRPIPEPKNDLKFALVVLGATSVFLGFVYWVSGGFK